MQMDIPLISNDHKKSDLLFDNYLSHRMKKKFEEQAAFNESLKVCISFLMHDMEVLEAIVQRQQNTIDRLCQDSVKQKDPELLHSEPKNPLGEKETSS